ncbi:MAG: TatD family hydrolase [Deltaproteobacteria bacterium]|jgi:TatD DNase family protein|nr:TatD family hydrolase [Deltaproteobacteria bacterium]
MGKKKYEAGPALSPEALALPPTGVDSHAHLDMRHFGDDLGAVLDRAASSGVAAVGNVFLSVEAWEAGKDRFTDRPDGPRVFFLLGIHPTDALRYSPAVRSGMIRAFGEDPRLRALGEIGLDFYWKDCPREAQIPAFIDQLHLARALGLPVVIHSRDAFDETVAILRDQGFFGYPLLWHCFGGNAEQAGILVEAKWHVSIPGPVTFPANEDLRAALAVIPPDRLLAETDCPYLAPMPYRGKRNEPAFAAFTVARMAEALGLPAAELWTRCGDNARAFFRLDGAAAG